ncbi:MAG TPA: response regulator [Planctomycetota bacterium]|nr:response regulator [Planctomycetota bacterium]
MTVTKVALVADESAEVRRSQRTLLHDLGFLAIEAEDGFQVLDLLRRARPSLVVLDLALRGLDGTEVLHFIRRNVDWMDIPVLVYSALTDTSTRRIVLQAGGTAFLEKPGAAPALRSAVSALFGLKGKERQAAGAPGSEWGGPIPLF